MEQDDHKEASGAYKPGFEDEQRRSSVDGLDGNAERMSIDQCHSAKCVGDSQLVRVPVTCGDVDMAEGQDGCLPEVKVGINVADGSVGKRKRGRPAKPKTATPQLRKERDEEDVCFICFDGGNLVLCDRRGCPKAYHPACIKRDESFFRSKAKWNCGWHICSVCQKASHYMCYTCTYSLCKGCTKDADYLCIRGNKGLCAICMKTIMLIENNERGSGEKCEVDFDDKSSWEYLFKVYWVYLKEKLSLTLDELLKAKNPWKGPATMGYKVETSHALLQLKDDKGSGSENSCIDIESNGLKNKKAKTEPMQLNTEDFHYRKDLGGDKGVSLPECTKWASKELLEFVGHMRNGDVSQLSQFDVQALLLEYAKKNNLRDPRQKSEIVCDARFVSLFGRERIRHIEMLALLESHFVIKDNAPPESIIRPGIVDAGSQLEANNNYNNQQMVVSDKRGKSRKKGDVQMVKNNPDAYAAINAHNINLIYLRRNLIENLMEDAEKFHDKVVGSMVRIRVSSSDEKQEMYRLVQVVGTKKVAEPYKIGTRTTDIALEILNLNRKEVISIDEVSNQEFSEDECKRLRQSIKYGISKRLTVGEIQDKALTLQAVRVNDMLQAEILRLNHLRDRASEKGHKKELRDCLEKLQLLNSHEEQQRRLLEFLEVHSDPNMDPMYDSDEYAIKSDERQDENTRSNDCGLDGREMEVISPRSWGGVLNDVECRAQNSMANTREHSGSAFTMKKQINPNAAAAGIVRSEASGVASDISSLPQYTGMDQSYHEKLWHYQDPSGKIQGPFSMLHLYKWSTSGHFPPDLKVWRIDEKADNSILLTDALSATGYKNVSLPYNSQQLDERDRDDGRNAVRNEVHSESGSTEWTRKQKLDDPSTQSNGTDESVRSDGCQPHSSCRTLPADGNHNEGQSGGPERSEESSKCEISHGDKPQGCPSLPSAAFSEKLSDNLSGKVRDGHGIEGNFEEDNENQESNRTPEGQSNSGHSYQKLSDSEANSGQSSGQSWRLPHITSSSSCVVTATAHVSAMKTSPQHQEFDVPSSQALPNPSVEEWDSSLKPAEVGGDGAASASPVSNQVTHSSPAHPVCNTTTWEALFGEPNEFDSLGDVSVSDLLAEVEAMESLGGLDPPTSIMKCGEELTEGSKTECLSPAEGLSPMPDAGKGDALSSTGDLQIPSQSTSVEEPLHHANQHHHHPRISGGESTKSAEVQVNHKKSSFSGNQWDVGPNIPSTVPSTATWDINTSTTWRLGSGSTNGGWESSHANANLGWSGMDQGNASISLGGNGMVQEDRNMNLFLSVGTQSYWGSQTRYGGDRFSAPSPRDRGHGRDSGFSRSRGVFNRQPAYGVGNGGSYRPLPKGQRVCKFYENGYCRKGASCDYLHP